MNLTYTEDALDELGIPTDRRLTCDEAFTVAEALNVLAHDYGLYAVGTALEVDLRFRAGMSRDTLEGIDEEARELYRVWEGWAKDADPYAVGEEARSILDALEDADEAP